jgi:NADP-dependent 3-hydroxy acid dehydrogenase YdfG
MTRIAVVTGASSGIGAATARCLAAHYTVYCVARRADRVAELAAQIGGVGLACDVTDPTQVAHLAQVVGPRVDLLVNNAGGALGLEPFASDDLARWQWMYQVNVVGAARVTQALLPALTRAEGTIVFVTSTAAEAAYEFGAGYCGVKSAERSMAEALRLELVGQPIRVCEVSPGLVHTAEFSLNRFNGDQAKADAVYAGVTPLVAEDIADVIGWMATRPAHVNIDRVVVRPRAQAGPKIVRTVEGTP